MEKPKAIYITEEQFETASLEALHKLDHMIERYPELVLFEGLHYAHMAEILFGSEEPVKKPYRRLFHKGVDDYMYDICEGGDAVPDDQFGVYVYNRNTGKLIRKRYFNEISDAFYYIIESTGLAD